MKTDKTTYLFFTIGVGLFAVIVTAFTVGEYRDFLLCEKNKVVTEMTILGSDRINSEVTSYKFVDGKKHIWESAAIGKRKIGDKITIVYNSENKNYFFPIEEYGKKHKIGFLISIALNTLLIYVIVKRKTIEIIRRPYHG
jgi:hypothetical protein